MIVLEWARFLIGGGLLLCGLGTFIIEIIGVFRFRYVLNRMHAAAIGDTLGIGFALLGLIVISGFNFTSLKLFLVIVFLWFSSPVSSHLIARLEVSTNEAAGRPQNGGCPWKGGCPRNGRYLRRRNRRCGQGT